jgi:dual specificity tyrosine-phosphorylation-regulated kinase 2/3/4
VTNYAGIAGSQSLEDSKKQFKV